MAGDSDIDDNEYVANLLKQDAKNAAKKYTMVGLDAFKSQSARPTIKPNTRFLNTVIRNVDSHNAALLAKETEESRARLRAMDREKEWKKNRSAAGRLSPPAMESDDATRPCRRKRRTEYDERERGRESKQLGAKVARELRGIVKSRGRTSEEGTRNKDERRREKRVTQIKDSKKEDSERRNKHSRRSRSPERRRHRHHRDESENDDWKHRHSRHPNSLLEQTRHWNRDSQSRSRSRSPRRSTHTSRRSHRDRSRSPNRRTAVVPRPNKAVRIGYESDSAPGLSSLPSKIKVRGRGAARLASGSVMDSHFSPYYDPKSDVTPASDIDDEDATERFKAKEQWSRLGADRLRAAGFTEEDIKKWEDGGKKKGDTNIDMSDFKWAKRGENREWDRGKVVDEEGDVGFKANWAG
ncbi:hypothetical protein GQ43DRAFT_452803 [Delitschia confertaspora ATCC 74209]|uniref:Pre-mRNA-splicing factor 38B n=1 Tax=Delitschia confertaspora ATCC 74209 TaxID=1513339 RepID=A0A9P4JVI8_9PLEO|nr:hypothetical protein GQ43DRAFT_452803 [Delitschia confertaspora ATCC 74209]